MRLHNLIRIMALTAAAMLVVALPAPTMPATAQSSMPSSGMVCTTSATADFTLTTQTGYISLPDGNTVYMWGLSAGSSPFQYPGPVLCVTEGQTVTITLNNTLDRPTSLIFPGQSEVLANGQPDQPVFSGNTLLSLATTVAPGASVTYRFVASNPGTYLYQSGTDSIFQTQMGLVGSLVVRPAMGATYAYDRADTQFRAGAEYLILMSEIDPILHLAIERGETFDMANYRARYFLYNGRAFPDTIAPNNAAWLPGQPYGSLTHIYPYHPTSNPLPALVRYLNASTSIYPHHPHGNHSRIIGRDGMPLEGSAQEDLSYEKFSMPIGPGQTWDVSFTWRDADEWDANNNPIPVTIPRDQNLTMGAYYGGSPYLGTQENLPVGAEAQNQCGEYYHIAHNHALQHTTSWGMTMSGQMTYTRIDPPLPNTCP